jgi:CHAT domain-containing protein
LLTSQVYFPSVLDNATAFSPKEIADKEGAARKRPVDEDIKAVTNLYSQLVKFCQETLKETGIEPQIIVTDHADNLALDGNIPFGSLIQGRRWRTRGFIENPEIS